MSITLRYAGIALCAILMGATAVGQDSLQPGELVFVDVSRHPEFTTTATVKPDGMIDIPMIGSVAVGGLDEIAATAKVRDALKRMLRNPRVTVTRNGSMPFQGAARTAVMRTELVPLHNSKAGEMADQLYGMSSDGGAISFHEDTNTLILTDTPDVLRNMMSVVGRLDEMQSQLTQVRIEAKIAEVQAGALKELGVRWFVQDEKFGGGYNPAIRQNTRSSGLFDGSGAPSNNEVTSGGSGFNSGARGQEFVNNRNFDRRLQIPVQVGNAGQMALGFFDGTLDIGAMVDALVADNQAELLANPNVLTVNHTPAKIEMLDEFPITEFGTESSGRSTTNIRFLDIGIKLDVTPHVMKDATGTYVKLELTPDVSFPSGAVGGVPVVSRRSIETVANVRDGQTLVLGGIFRNELQNSVEKVPLLGDLPLFGTMFKRKTDSSQKTELMVFVTPRVHLSPESVTWDQMINITDPWADDSAAGLGGLKEARRE